MGLWGFKFPFEALSPPAFGWIGREAGKRYIEGRMEAGENLYWVG
jgi:hypothetical protein